MKRRAFLFAVPALGAALGARAQQAGKVYRVAVILTTAPIAEMQGAEPAHPVPRALLQALRRLGYVEGSNLVLERRSAEGRQERYGEIVSELLRLKPDAIVTVSVPLALAAKKQTTTVPIVFAIAGEGDAVLSGLVPSLSRPGGNVTGFLPHAGAEIAGKRLEMLKQAAPGIARVAYLGLASEWKSAEGRSAQAAAKALGISLSFAESRGNDFTAAFEAIRQQRADALLVSGHGGHFTHSGTIIEFAARHRLADMHAFGSSVEAGGLMSYGPEGTQLPQVATYLDRIFKGEKPGDLPVQQATNFNLVINAKTARARGLTLPPALLLRANRVIE